MRLASVFRRFALVIRYLAIVAGTVLIFQNCSNVVLTQPPQFVEISSIKPKNKICAPVGTSFSSSMKFIFLVDMSMSNVGSLHVSTFNYRSSYSINKTDGPADIEGKRFDEIKKFIEECGGSDTSQYAVIGFAKDTFFSPTNSCLSPFESRDEALKSIDTLKAMQMHDLSISSGENTNPYYLQGETHYSSGLGCLKSKISEDLNLLNNEKPAYNTYFITDGMATDPADKRNYSQILTEINLLASEGAGGLNFYPVFYTSPGAKNQGSEQIQAINLLNQMASTIDPNQQTIFLNNIGATNNELCEKLDSKVRVNYTLQSLYAININAVFKNNHLKVDTDGDGIPDDIEELYGWDPQNPRSTGMLDSLCVYLGGVKADCLKEREKYSCEGDAYKLGLNDCDLKIASKIFGADLTGVDSDLDGIPDFIEIIRGSHPARVDVFENPSGDGINNLQKITQGLDIHSNLKNFPVEEEKKVEIKFSLSDVDCEEGREGYEYEIVQAPLIEASPYMGDQTFSSLQREENENSYLVISYWQAEGGLSLPNRIYYQNLRLKIGSELIKFDDRILLGETP